MEFIPFSRQLRASKHDIVSYWKMLKSSENSEKIVEIETIRCLMAVDDGVMDVQ